jgi:hypothetical protein
MESDAQAFRSLAALAPGLSEAELRVALYLASIQDAGTHTAQASSREIEAATRVARRNVQRALDSLARRCLVVARRGGAKTGAFYLLNWTQTTALRSGVMTTPLVQPELPGVASQRRHPLAPDGPLDRIDIDHDSIIDRVLTARAQHFQTSELNLVRGFAYKWLTLQRGQEHAQAPDGTICAQIITAAGGAGRAVAWITERLQDRQAESCAYLVSWMLEKLHGVAPPAVKRRRAELRVVQRSAALESSAAPGSPAPDPDPEFSAEIARQAVAGVHKLR